jgi:D-alanyl-D-alanine carboxypeptidase (penicillin-binding protein 5/6)
MAIKQAGWAVALALLALPIASGQPRSSTAPAAQAPRHVAILDNASGALLRCDNCNTPMPPASMSKLMTALLVAEELAAGRITENTVFRVSERAWRHGAQSSGSHMFLPLNGEVRVGDLLRGAIIVSANDACIVLAEGIAGSVEAYVARMNERAAALGLQSARFVNVTGLDPDDDEIPGTDNAQTLISAADLGRLARHIIAAHPDLFRIYSERSFTYGPHRPQENRNPLLGRFAGADGMKTGYTEASGYGLVGTAARDGQRRIIVFNGARSMQDRASIAEQLMASAFSDFVVRRVYAAGETVGSVPVRLGSRRTVDAITTSDIFIAAPRSAFSQLSATLEFTGPLRPPVDKDSSVATLVVEGAGLPPQRFPLVAARRIGHADPFSRAAAGLGVLIGGE